MVSNKSILLKNNDMKIYAVIEDDVFQIFNHDIARNKDEIWVKGQYRNMKFISKTDFLEKDKYHYVILKGLDGTGSLVDLISGKTILENFHFDDYVGHHKYITFENHKNVTHIELSFNNKEEKEYSVYSTVDRKYIIGPIKYNSIEICRNGVILDNTYAIENNGRTIDLSEYNYSEKSRVYINKEKNQYLVNFDYEGQLFYNLHKSREKGILTVRLHNSYYFYNIAEDRLYKKGLSHVWTKRELAEAADIAYEGHSRLELGLE